LIPSKHISSRISLLPLILGRVGFRNGELTGPVTTAPEPVDQVPEKPVEFEVKSCWAETKEICLAGSREAIRREEERVKSDNGVNMALLVDAEVSGTIEVTVVDLL